MAVKDKEITLHEDGFFLVETSRVEMKIVYAPFSSIENWDIFAKIHRTGETSHIGSFADLDRALEVAARFAEIDCHVVFRRNLFKVRITEDTVVSRPGSIPILDLLAREGMRPVAGLRTLVNFQVDLGLTQDSVDFQFGVMCRHYRDSIGSVDLVRSSGARDLYCGDFLLPVCGIYETEHLAEIGEKAIRGIGIDPRFCEFHPERLGHRSGVPTGDVREFSDSVAV